MHQPQTMSHLVSDNIVKAFIQYVLWQLFRAHSFIYLCGLHETHIVHELDDIVVNIHGSVDNLPGTRVCPRGPHPVSHIDRRITDARIFQVVRVKFRVIHREIFCLHHVFKTDFLESGIPFQDSRMDCFFPFSRKCIVDVEHNGFHRLDQFTPLVCLHILRLHVPAIHEINVF